MRKTKRRGWRVKDTSKMHHIPWNKGLKMSDDFCKKVSDGHLGQISWNKGKKGLQKQSDELRRYRSEYAKSHNFGKWMKGKFTPKETIEKLRLAANKPENLKIAIQNGINTALKVREGKETDIEKKVRLILEDLKINFIPQLPVKISIADFFIEPNKLIYVDGDYWHNRPSKRRQDIGITNYLKKGGYKVLRIKGSEINKYPIRIKSKIKCFVKT
jgi:very-short-patch-repair endonuclease